MSPVLNRLEVFFYNFTSVFCVTKEKDVLRVSNFAAVCNILKMPFYLAFTVFSFTYFEEELVHEKFDGLKQFSTFSKVLLLVTSITGLTSAFLFTVLQVVRRQEFTKFVNVWLQKQLAEEYFQQYRNDCFKYHTAEVIVVSIHMLCQYLGAGKHSLISLVSSLVFMQPNIMLFGVLSFVTCFQNYVIALLTEFNDELIDFAQGAALNQRPTMENYLKVSKKYQEIHEFVDQFRKCFGVQITLIFCYVTFGLISSVVDRVR